MLLLAIETATDVCSVAVFGDGRLLASVSERRPRIHAERLVPMISELLRSVNFTPGELDVVALSSGPGSYTGLRIGAATAKGLLFSTGARLVAVSTLEALAWNRMRSGNTGIAVAMPSRRGECYLGAWSRDDDGPPARRMKDSIVEIGNVLARLLEACPEGAELVVPAAEAPNRFAEQLAAVLPATTPFRVVEETPNAENVGLCAESAVELRHFEDVTTFEPYYLRDFEARKPKRSIFDRLPF
jgi:tRNA threonylcarbamoyladenosine biosynthesis protein TsaB